MQGTVNWNGLQPRQRLPPDSIGIGLIYSYDMVTPLPACSGSSAAGATQLQIHDRTVMALNPS